MRNQIRNTLCTFIGLIGFAAMPALAAIDHFLCIDGLKGETKQVNQKDCIDILAWSWGASNSSSLHLGGGGGTGKPNFQDISFTKWIDTSSTDLLGLVSTGEKMGKLDFKAYKAGCQDCGGWPTYRLEVEANASIVTSVSTGGAGGEDRLTENITINFSKFKYCYTPVDAEGKVLQANETCYAYDIAENVPLR